VYSIVLILVKIVASGHFLNISYLDNRLLATIY